MAGACAPQDAEGDTYDIVIVSGGSAGIATAASILRRNPGLSLAIVEPSEAHYYQPGWTMVGAGIFNREFTRRAEARLIPEGANWIKASASGFAPDENKVLLCDGRNLSYRVLIACPRSEEHTSELQSLMRISYAVLCLQNKKQQKTH